MDFEDEDTSLFSTYYRQEFEKRYTDYHPPVNPSQPTTSPADDVAAILVRAVAHFVLLPFRILIWLFSSGLRSISRIAIVIFLGYIAFRFIKATVHYQHEQPQSRYQQFRVVCKKVFDVLCRIRLWSNHLFSDIGSTILYLYYNGRYNLITDRTYLYWLRFIFAIEKYFWRGCFLAVLFGWMFALLIGPISPWLKAVSPTEIRQRGNFVPQWMHIPQWGQGPKYRQGSEHKSDQLTIYDKPYMVWLSDLELEKRDDEPFVDVVESEEKPSGRMMRCPPSVTKSPRSSKGKSTKGRSRREKDGAAVSTRLAWCDECQQIHCCGPAVRGQV